MMKKDNGFVLVTGMVFLLVITIIVIYLLRGSILQEKMTGNAIDRQRALQAADAVLRAAEDLISAGGPPYDPFVIDQFTATCANSRCANLNATDLWAPTTFSWSNTKTLLSFNKVAAAPNYVIELVAPPVWTAAEGCAMATYKIIAKGVGKIGAESMVQSYFQIRPKVCR